MADLLPTPSKSHYTFNLRDFSRVIQGVLMVRPKESFDKLALVRLWAHEALRVFGDRLIDGKDRDWFTRKLEQMCIQHFNVKFYDGECRVCDIISISHIVTVS
jgi:dynein heavy chain, axonemal